MDKVVTLSVILMLVGSLICGYVVARLGWSGAARLEGRPRAARRSGGEGPHGGLAARGRTEVWRRGPAGWVAAATVCGSGAEILMHVDRLCCYG